MEETTKDGVKGTLQRKPSKRNSDILIGSGENEKVLRVEGGFFVDEDGNIDFKAHDETVEFGWNQSQDWDPTPVLKALYDSRKPERAEAGSKNGNAEGDADGEDKDKDQESTPLAFGQATVRIEGYLEKLPKGQQRAGVLSRWNRRYFKARDGELFYYEDNRATRPSGFIRLRGSEVRYKGGNLLEIFDPKNKVSMVLRASSTAELEDWKMALDAEASSLRRRVIKNASRIEDMRNTLIFDIGTCSARAGFAEPQGLAWPNMYMPACVAVNKLNSAPRVVGMEALTPDVRGISKVAYPLRGSSNVHDGTDVDLLETIYGDLFRRLTVDPGDRTVILTEPQFATDRDRTRIAEIMMETFRVPAMYMKHQALLSMYSYGATTGVIVDIGDRLDIIPLDSGYIIEKGVSKMRVGGGHITESLTRMMAEEGHRFFSSVEHYIGRLVKERVAYVAPDYRESLRLEEQDKIEPAYVDARRFAVPDGTKTFTVKGARFRCAEGLFQPDLWGKVRDGKDGKRCFIWDVCGSPHGRSLHCVFIFVFVARLVGHAWLTRAGAKGDYGLQY